MIRLIEALSYRCLRYIRQPLGPFHVLVGPNASGKTTFLDVPAFLGRLVCDGVDAAVSERTPNLYDLLWERKGDRFELAIEAAIPDEYQRPLDSPLYDTIRYEVAIGLDSKSKEHHILDEQILLIDGGTEPERPAKQPGAHLPATIFLTQDHPSRKRLVSKGQACDINVAPEQPRDEHGQRVRGDHCLVLRQNPRKSILGELFEDEFPAAAWLADLLRRQVFALDLSNMKLRRPNPPGKGVSLQKDGGNLAWFVSALQEGTPDLFSDWIAHLRTALPDLVGIRLVERPEDKHMYLMLRYPGGLEVPSWMVSDGTLRLLAFTVIAYMRTLRPVLLIEEPENSIHPLNAETIMQSLRSIYGGQVLVATHSPVILGVTKPEEVLVFSRDEKHGTRITVGCDHPGLLNWRGEVSLGTLFAGGVLG